MENKKDKKIVEHKDTIKRVPLSKLVSIVNEFIKTHPKDMEMLKNGRY